MFFSGGTVDITVYEVLEDDFMIEVIEPTGGPWGGANVNKAFWKLLESSLYMGAEFCRQMKQEKPNIWWDIQREFEHKKMTPQGDRNVNIFTVPKSMACFYQNITNKDILYSIGKESTHNVSVDEDYALSISPEAMQRLFSSNVDKIVRHVRSLLQRPKLTNVSYLFMVGGFSKSRYLTEIIKNTFSPRLKVFVQQDPDLAVMKGAVIFWQEQTTNPG